MDDTLVVFGGGVKALDESGKIGGHLVLFGTPERTDASSLRDYFTKATNFGLDVTTKTRVLYHHGLDKQLGLKSLGVGVGEMKADDLGIWLEHQLDLRDAYEQKIWGMVKDGKLGYSSGTASHLIRREKQPNGSSKIVAWPLGLDASLTTSPAEPRTAAVALKTLAADWLKGEHLGPYAEHGAAMSAVRSTHDRLGYAIADALGDDKMARAAKLSKIKAAHDEARETVLRVVGAVLPEPEAATKSADLELLELQALQTRRAVELAGLLDF